MSKIVLNQLGVAQDDFLVFNPDHLEESLCRYDTWEDAVTRARSSKEFAIVLPVKTACEHYKELSFITRETNVQYFVWEILSELTLINDSKQQLVPKNCGDRTLLVLPFALHCLCAVWKEYWNTEKIEQVLDEVGVSYIIATADELVRMFPNYFEYKEEADND